jgi:hypothetical protein
MKWITMALVRTIAGVPVITFSILRFVLFFLPFTSLCKDAILDYFWFWIGLENVIASFEIKKKKKTGHRVVVEQILSL